MNLREKAQGEGPEVVLPADQPDRPAVRLLESDLYLADDLTPEGQFPEFGDFLRVQAVDLENEPLEDEPDEEYWSAPKALANVLVEWAGENEEELTNLVVDVDSVHKTPTGEWRYVSAVESVADEE